MFARVFKQFFAVSTILGPDLVLFCRFELPCSVTSVSLSLHINQAKPTSCGSIAWHLSAPKQAEPLQVHVPEACLEHRQGYETDIFLQCLRCACLADFQVQRNSGSPPKTMSVVQKSSILFG